MEMLGERPAWSLNDTEKLSRLDATVAELSRLKTYYLQLIADLDSSGYAKEIGAGDTARLVSTRYLVDLPEARRDVRTANSLHRYQAVATALPDPAVPFPADTSVRRAMQPAQAAVVIAELEKAPDQVPADNLRVAEKQLVNLARTFTPGELRRAGVRIRTILDPDGPEPDEKRAYQRESLTLRADGNGVRFGGFLANDNAELFRTLIHAGAKPRKTLDGEPDPRARDKRQADALTALLTTAAGVLHTTAGDHDAAEAVGRDPIGEIASGGYIPGHGPKAHLTVTIDFDALTSTTAGAVGDTVFGDGLSAAAVRRLACDAQVIPVVLGSRSQPLDVGTTKRLVTGAMRLALNARDRGCVVCGAPPIHCEAHHLVHWIDGGETRVSNLVLLCKRHHLDLHAGHWHIEITNDVVHVTRPTWATPPPIPQARYRPATHSTPTHAANPPPDANLPHQTPHAWQSAAPTKRSPQVSVTGKPSGRDPTGSTTP